MMSYEKAAEGLRQYQEQSGKSNVMIAKELGYSSGSVITDFLKGSYKAQDTFIKKLEEFLAYKQEQQEQEANIPTIPYVETSAAKKMMKTFRDCQLRGILGCVFGDAGVGKTTCTIQYCKENNLAVRISMKPTTATITGINYLLGQELGIRERNNMFFGEELVRRLSGTGSLILVDEAQFLTRRTLEYLRTISDAAGIGIVFVGNEATYRMIKQNGSNETSMLYNRIGGDPCEIKTRNFKREDIEKLFSSVPMDERSLDMLYKVTGTFYSLRGAMHVYYNTFKNYKNLEPQNMAKVVKEMMIV